jgi:NAD-dependent SIR2 family protein deacetylase
MFVNERPLLEKNHRSDHFRPPASSIPTHMTTDIAESIHSPLQSFVSRYNRLFVLTGAGCSTDSGIPDYRDTDGAWKRKPPITFQAFTGDAGMRSRYWARSLIGWRHFGHAQPNATHTALAQLQRQGRMEVLVTQNVDGLHQAAGSEQVIDLHGRLDEVLCLECGHRIPRAEFQHQLATRNPDWVALDASLAPDGDADLDGLDFSTFQVPNCPACGGILKPDVVFFGENVPRERVDQAAAHMQAADAMLVVGSSLMVYSGYRFAVAAHKRGIPIASINLGRTRADPLLSLKINLSCADALSFIQCA